MKNNSKLANTVSTNKSFDSNPVSNIEILKKVYHWIGEGIRCLFFEKTFINIVIDINTAGGATDETSRRD